MFLLNSRSPLVTATSLSLGWHPLSRSYGAKLPNSLAYVVPDTPWTTHPGAPVSVLGTVTSDDTDRGFHGHQVQRKPPKGGPITVSPPSHHYGSPEGYALDHAGKHGPHTPMCPGSAKVARGAGILTCFPFPNVG